MAERRFTQICDRLESAPIPPSVECINLHEAEGKYTDARAPLERYVKLEPDDPAGHYQLAIADARTGDQEGARQQMALQAQAAARNHSSDTTLGHVVHP